MADIPAIEFKARCLALMDRVAERQESFVITKRGKPRARLVPLESKGESGIFGWMRSRGSIEGDIISPPRPADPWEAVTKWDELVAPERPRPARPRTPTKRRTRSSR